MLGPSSLPEVFVIREQGGDGAELSTPSWGPKQGPAQGRRGERAGAGGSEDLRAAPGGSP